MLVKIYQQSGEGETVDDIETRRKTETTQIFYLVGTLSAPPSVKSIPPRLRGIPTRFIMIS